MPMSDGRYGCLLIRSIQTVRRSLADLRVNSRICYVNGIVFFGVNRKQNRLYMKNRKHWYNLQWMHTLSFREVLCMVEKKETFIAFHL